MNDTSLPVCSASSSATRRRVRTLFAAARPMRAGGAASAAPPLLGAVRSVRVRCAHGTYGDPTQEALFQHVLSDDEVRTSFLRAFVPRLAFVSSARLDARVSPEAAPAQSRLAALAARHRGEARRIRGAIQDGLVVVDDAATVFLHDLLADTTLDAEGVAGRPPQGRSPHVGMLDFLCSLENGTSVLVGGYRWYRTSSPFGMLLTPKRPP